ncbi:unnamed protein product [Victoria cruziana]
MFFVFFPFPQASFKVFQSGEHTGILEEIIFTKLSCLRVVSTLASVAAAKEEEESLWTSSPSTVEVLHPWPLQEAKERRIQRISLKTFWLGI